MAPQKQLEDPRVTGEGTPSSQIHPPSSKMVAGGKQCAPRATITPTKTCPATVYRCLKRRLGRSLKRAHYKGNLVSSRKPITYQLSRVEGSLSSTKRLPKPLSRQHSSNSHRQHYSSVLHKQGRGYEVGPFVCPSMEDTDLVHQKKGHPQSPTHSRSAECGSRQAIQAGSDYPDRVVSPSRGIPGDMRQVARTTN